MGPRESAPELRLEAPDLYQEREAWTTALLRSTHDRVNATARLIGLILATYADGSGLVLGVGLQRLADDAGYQTRRAARDGTRSLEEAGLLIVTKVGTGRGQKLRYRLVIPEPSEGFRGRTLPDKKGSVGDLVYTSRSREVSILEGVREDTLPRTRTGGRAMGHERGRFETSQGESLDGAWRDAVGACPECRRAFVQRFDSRDLGDVARRCTACGWTTEYVETVRKAKEEDRLRIARMMAESEEAQA